MAKGSGTTKSGSKSNPRGLSNPAQNIATTGVYGAVNSALDKLDSNLDFNRLGFGRTERHDLGHDITVAVHKGTAANGVGVLRAVARINGEEIADETAVYKINDDYEAVVANADIKDAIRSAIIKNRNKIKL